jgi:hypothetical protein
VQANGSEWDVAKDLSEEMINRFNRVLVDTPTRRALKRGIAIAA